MADGSALPQAVLEGILIEHATDRLPIQAAIAAIERLFGRASVPQVSDPPDIRWQILDALFFAANHGQIANGANGAMALLEKYDAALRAGTPGGETRTLRDALIGIQSQCAGHADEFSATVWRLAEKALSGGRGDPVRFAFADPPYIGQAKKHYAKEAAADGRVASEVDHADLIQRLCFKYDGWALSLSTPSLEEILGLCRTIVGPNEVRVGAWVKPFASFKKGVNPAYCWEPVIFWGGRKLPSGDGVPTLRDYVSSNITLQTGYERSQAGGFLRVAIPLPRHGADRRVHRPFPRERSCEPGLGEVAQPDGVRGVTKQELLAEVDRLKRELANTREPRFPDPACFCKPYPWVSIGPMPLPRERAFRASVTA